MPAVAARAHRLLRTSSLLALLLLTCLPSLLAQRAEHLNYQVNSAYEEREPMLSPDGKTLYFWRRAMPANTGGLPDPGDIWFSRQLGDGSWTSAVRAAPPLNSMGHDFVWHVDEDTIWINQVAPGSQEDGIKYSLRDRNGFWQAPQDAHIHHFTYEGTYKDFFMGPGRIMLLPNEGQNSYGGTDIYVCFPINDTAWSNPINLGPTINTAGDDDAPFLAPDGMTLYFNSNGHDGFGDHDVFVSTRLDDSWQHWTEPVNLGHPINTPGYDFDFVITEDGEYAYWGSESNTYGSNDIFRMPLNTCELTVYPQGNHEVCRGEAFTLEAGFADESGLRYQWKKDGQVIPGATKRQLTITEEGSYSLLRIRPRCTRESEPQRIRFIDPPEAEIKTYAETICLDDSVRLRTTAQRGASFQWQKNGLDIPAANEAVYWVKSPGDYSVRVSNGSCERTSAPISLNRFDEPSIFQAKDTLERSPLLIPQWVWTNKLEEPRGDRLLQDLATSAEGAPYLLSLERDRRGRLTEQVTAYFPEGPFRFSLPERSVQPGQHRFLAIDPEGNLIISRDEQYLSKHRSDGKLLWRIDQSIDRITGLCTDDIGNIYTMGRFQDTLVLAGKAFPATKRGSMFLAKHDGEGVLQWVRSMSVDWYKYDFGNALHTDCQGNLYLAGGFSTIANFRKKILRGSLGGYSYFLAKYNTHGDFQWAQKITTDKMGVRTHDISTDCQGNTYLLFNYLLQKYNAEGDRLYEHTLKAPGLPRTLRIAATDLQDLYISGITQEKGELFVTKLDRSQRQVMLWRGRGGSEDLDDLPIITADGLGNVYVAGNSKSADAPPGTMLALRGKSDGFLAKYGKKRPSLRPETITLCKGESTTLMVHPAKGISYQWLRNGTEIPGAIGPRLRVSEEGDYQLRATASPCERLSAIQSVVIDCDGNPFKPPKPPLLAEQAPTPSELETDRKGRPSRLKNRRIKEQDELSISNPEVSIFLWDHGADDQDTISININGVWVLENYRLSKEKKEIKFRFDPGNPHNVIILYAHNLGRISPNTAAIMIDDGVEQQSSRLRSNLNSNGAIHVNFSENRGYPKRE